MLSGCKQKESENKQEKLENELEYISAKIFNLADKLNNVSFENYEIISKEIEIKEESVASGSEASSSSSSKEGGEEEKKAETIELKEKNLLDNNPKEDIDWKNIKKEIEEINNIWTVVSIDLKNEKVADNDIDEFNNSLNQTIISIKNENREETLNNITNLYSSIPIFTNYIYTENISKVINNVKFEVLKAYTSASVENWDNVSEHISKAQNSFFDILIDKNSKENQKFKIDKIERLIQNLADSAELKDIEVFLLNYKILMENINTL